MSAMICDFPEWRARLVETLRRLGSITLPQVDAASRAVPRHVFVPHVASEEASRIRDPDGDGPVQSRSRPDGGFPRGDIPAAI